MPRSVEAVRRGHGGPRRSRWRCRGAVFALLAFALPVATPSGQGHAAGRTLVIPFETVGSDPRFAWLHEGVAIRLSDELESRGVNVADRRQRLQALAGMGIPPRAMVSEPTALVLGRLLDADRVVAGALQFVGAELVITVDALAVGSERIDRFVRRGPIEEFGAVVSRLTDDLAFGPERQPDERPVLDLPLDAFELYVKGLVAGSTLRRLEFLEAAVDRAPDDLRTRAALWAAAMDGREVEAALDAVLSVPEGGGSWPTGDLLASQSLLALGRLEEAEALLKPLTDENAEEAALTCRGLLELERRTSDGRTRAAYYFHEAVLLAPDDGDALFNLGYAYWVADDPQGAAYWLKEAARRNPTDAQARWLLGAAFRRQGLDRQARVEDAIVRFLTDEADAWASQLTQDADDTGDTPIRLKDQMIDPADRQFAVSLRQALAAERRRRSAAHLEQATTSFLAGSDAEAIAAATRAIRWLPDQAEPYLLLSRVHLRAAHYAAAAETAGWSVWFADGVAARLVAAESFLALNDVDAARRELGRALQLDPASPEGADLLLRLEGAARP